MCLSGRPRSLPAAGFAWAALCAAWAFAASEDRALYPRPLGEIKAMLQVLAPDRGPVLDVPRAYIQRLKQYRYICGVPYEDLLWDEGYARLAEAASNVCAKLGRITHSPSQPAGMSNEEYQLGKKGAGSCNLYQGVSHPVACVDGWMADSDPSNINRVGHRRWCLNPAMGKSAFGATAGFAAMYAMDSSLKKPPDWDYIAYPARGHMPLELFGARHAWSVSPNMGKYGRLSKGDVKVTVQPVGEKLEPQGSPLSLDYFNVESGGYGSGPIVIFRPAGLKPSAEERYQVEISGLKTKAGQPAKIEYLVHFVNFARVPDGPEGRPVYTAYFNKRLAAAQALTDKLARLHALAELTEDKFLAGADSAVSSAARNAYNEMLKDPALRREEDARQRYTKLVEAEQKAGKSKTALTQVAFAYRDLASAYKGTQAAQRATESFERLKQTLQ